MSNPNVVFLIGFVQHENRLSKNKVLWGKYAEKRAYYSCNKTDIDYLRYIEKGLSEQSQTKIMDYAEYSGNSDKSEGVFNANGLMNKKEKSMLRKSLRKTESVIWHGIISFEESFGLRYIQNANQAQQLLASEFPKFFKAAGFDPNKIEWFAGLHENTDNKHIHFSFYEKEPSRYTPHKKGLNFSSGKISARHFEQFKVRIEQKLTDISSQIKAARKDLTELSKNLLFSKERKIEYQRDIQKQLNNLLLSIPKDGRISYSSENMRVMRPQIIRIIDDLIKLNKPLYNKFIAFVKEVKRKDTITLEILKTNKISENTWKKYLVADKYLEDIYRRLGNQIIESVQIIKRKQKKTKNRLANKRIERKSVQALLEYSLYLGTQFEVEATRVFEDYLYKLQSGGNDIKFEMD